MVLRFRISYFPFLPFFSYEWANLYTLFAQTYTFYTCTVNHSRVPVECSKYEDKNSYLIKRIVSPTCELKSPVKAAILNTNNEVQVLRSKVETLQNTVEGLQNTVQSLQNTVEDIANLIKKPITGKLIFFPRKMFLCFVYDIYWII
jgi:hypothetical protein